MNGRSQRPVMSMISPNTTGEIMPARPKPKFMKPEAVPEYWGAMSIGTAQIGATINSAKKNAPERHRVMVSRSVVNSTGSMKAKAPRKPTTMTLTRAWRRRPSAAGSCR